MFQSKIHWGSNLLFFGLRPWAIIHGTAKLVNTFISHIWNLMIPFERSLSKLSENPNIFNIGSTVLKLWLLKDVQLINGLGTLSATIKSLFPTFVKCKET